MNDAPPPYRTVVLDCDSTLSAVEGIDELAARAGVDVAELTVRAMEGELALEDVYAHRLERVRPSAADLAWLGLRYVEREVAHARALCAALRFLGKRTAIVSGGLEPAVRALARDLGVPAPDVFAVAVEHAPDGRYLGFDSASPLARSKGKIAIVRGLADESGPLVLIGDGVTDLEAAPAAARFVAFGGVARRQAVFERARAACYVPDLAGLVRWILTPGEIERLAGTREHAPLVAAARRLGTS